jgi:lycopene cyclase domain-containing protein
VVFWSTYPIVIVFQLLSNGILTGRHIVIYDPAAILGLRIAYAPVEDLLFGFALVLLTLSLWVWLGRRGVDRSPRAGEGSALLDRLR